MNINDRIKVLNPGNNHPCLVGERGWVDEVRETFNVEFVTVSFPQINRSYTYAASDLVVIQPSVADNTSTK